jgi:general secretion pathway protein D
MVSLNFNRADLVEIIHIIAQQLRLTYTIDPEVKGTVTINSAEPLRAEDLLPIFHQLLRMNGAVAVRTGNLYHIMPIKDGKGLARPLGQGKEDSFALQVIPVRFFSVAEMKRVLTPFLQPGGEIVENPRGNFLIVMDLPSNIQRLMEIAEMIDVQVFAGTRMEIYQPKVASAEELAQEMTKVMQSFASSVPQAESFAAQFVALPRINQLLVISHSEAAWTYAKRWLDRLDIIAEGPGRRIFIYPVENGKATELADVLSQALGQPSTGRRDTTRTLQELHRSTPGGTNPTPGRGTTGTGSFGTSGSFGQQSQPLGAYAAVPAPGQVTPPPVVPSAPTPLPPTAPRPPAQTPQAQQQQQQQEQLRIVPDPATNSLIIYGTVQEFQNIKNILKELDAIPRQVLIEAMILQVDLTDTESLGVDIEILRRPRVTIFGQTFASQGALRTLANNFPTAPTFGSGSGLSGIVGGRDVQAIINALMTDARVKLISSPSVLAADNRPARIQVGSEEPIPTGTINAVVGSPGVSSSTTIQYRNTGRILTILPQVNTKGLVNLQIKAEVSARGDDVTVGQDRFPAFNTQDAETTAVVEDGETLVIGGLIGERKSKSRTGIPYLMDIPVVGRFFGTTTDQAQRTELIMLITPRVIRSRDEAQTASEEFKSKLGAVRNELDRIERERAKSKPHVPPPAQTPAIPKEEIPPPAPSRTAPGAGAMWAPPYDSIASLVNQGQVLTPVTPAEPTIEATPMLQLMSKSKSDAQPAAQQDPAKRGGVVARPAYALSFAPYKPPVPVAPSRNMIARLAQPRINREWAVQLAALAEKKDAESIVNTLQKNGYEAYVMTIQTGTKTWHRVRVGQMADVKVANELKKTLASTTAFKQAYVAAN